MITCQQAAEMLGTYLDKELDNENVKQIEEHLEKCKGCVGHTAFNQTLRQLLKKQVIQESLSEKIKQEIQKKLAEICDQDDGK